MPNAETLLWLNDRVGEEIHVELLVTTRDRRRKAFAVFTGGGILRHWSEGWYAVGEEMHFDPTDLDASIRRRSDDELLLELADGVVAALRKPGSAGPTSFSPISRPRDLPESARRLMHRGGFDEQDGGELIAWLPDRRQCCEPPLVSTGLGMT